ncbi:hypothetical protein K501DRAFT_280604 [Backusella circina FSU 941]|nr:hypothetical protein K501DRAFT_280604 [Backusella circina FSU 941]
MANQNERAPEYTMTSTYAPPAPPPAYHDSTIPSNNLPGETYYQPPALNETCPPPPIQHIPETAGQNRIVAFYKPDNRRLALRRRISSCLCCCIILIIIIGLAAGLTRSTYYGTRYCECRTNADCVEEYAIMAKWKLLANTSH